MSDFNNSKINQQKKADYSKYEDTFILHNIGNKQIKKHEYNRELHRFKTKCAQCKLIVERVCRLIDEIRTIKENEVIGVCEHCKRATSLNKTCKRCNIIVGEFISMHEKTRQRQQCFKVWLCTVKHLLQAIVDGKNVCQHRVYRDTELERILHAIKEPLTIREPDIDLFPNLDQENVMLRQSMSENKETLEELLSKLEFVGENRDSSSESLHPSPSEEMCLCKYLKEKVEGGIAGVGVISDASKALGLGLTNNQNKKMVHDSVNNLNKALNSSTEEVQRLSIGFKNTLPKDVSKDLCSRYSKGKKSFEVAGTGEAIDKSLSNSQTGIAKKINKPRKSASKKPLQLQRQTSEERSKKHSLSDKTSKSVSRNVSKLLRSRYSKEKSKSEIAGNVEVIDKSLSDSQTGIAKKVTKPRKSASEKPLQLQQQTSEKQRKKDSSSDKTSRKKLGLERADQRGLGQYSSDDKDTENLKKEEKDTKLVKGKGNLSPEGEKKKKYFKSQSKQSTPPLTGARELSEILLHKNLIKEEKFKLKRQLDKMTEKERIRFKKLTVKNVTKIKKIIPLPSSRDEVTKLVISEDTVPFDTKHIKKKTIEPLLSKTQLQSADDSISRGSLKYQTLFDGAVKYQLSNEEFIRKGWTILPTEKIMRRMNIYRMEPADSRNCWFEQHQQDGELFYDSGQKLADIDHNGRGHWYYRNGNVALDYYDAQESNIGQRYVVYSSGTETDCGKVRPRTILALFDVLGHGVIYDLHGNVRLKYNQSEGLVVDPKIGPQSKWKWHTLNDPPILQRVFVNKCLKERDPNLERVKKSTISNDTAGVARPANSEMVSIELDNLIKEKRFKLKQKFRPFQIRIKTVKLNEQFSLKILDQATINLLYRDGVTRLKLSLGMLLKSDEIIDTVTSDLGDVSTPYDIRPAKTESVENIQKILKAVRSGKVHTLGA